MTQVSDGRMRSMPDPSFADDTGAADPRLAEVMAAYAAGEARFVEVLQFLQDTRLLVPVLPVPGRVDDSNDMAVALMTGRSGRLGLLVFTSVSSLRSWRPEARPVPVTARAAARSAVQQDAAALLIDVAGPVRTVVENADLHALASGWQLVHAGTQAAWIGPRRERSATV